MTNPHIEAAARLLDTASANLFEGSGAAATIALAQAHATLAIAVELKATREALEHQR